MSKRNIVPSLSCGIFVFLVVCVVASSSQRALLAHEDVRHTKHNLAVNPDIRAGEGVDFRSGDVSPLRGPNNPTVRGIDGVVKLNEEVCIFCHTPHGARAEIGGVAGAGPLWNRRLSDAMAFIPYSSPNFDAQDALGLPGRPKGVSLACLSCHDGVVAFDALVNATGSSSFSTANRTGTGFGGSVGMSFGGVGADPQGSFREGLRSSDDVNPRRPGFVFFDETGSGPNASGGMEPFPNLGLDLRDDHPISMEIPLTDPQFAEILTNIATKGGRIPGSGSVMWLDRDPNGANLPLDKRDRLRAYASDPNRPDAPYVECASCHNPHDASRPGGQPALTDPVNPRTINNNLFLRMASRPAGEGVDTQDRNAGSLLCLSCHKK